MSDQVVTLIGTVTEVRHVAVQSQRDRAERLAEGRAEQRPPGA